MGCVVVAMVCGGLWLYEWRQARLPEWNELPPREVRARVELSRVFPPAEGARSVSALGRIVESDAHVRELVGQRVFVSFGRSRGTKVAAGQGSFLSGAGGVKVKKRGDKVPSGRQKPKPEPLPLRGSVVSVVGVLEVVPEGAGLGSFESFLNNEGIHFRISRGRVVEVVGEAGWWARFCDAGLRRLSAILGEGVEGKRGDLTGVFRAMLLGQKHELNEGQRELFMHSGTMHLFAISGLHVAAVAVAIEMLLMLLRLPLRVRFFAGLGVLWLYVSVTGQAPSAVRAFLMVAMFQAARVFRLPGNAFSGLCAAAFGVLVVSPMQLFGASFQMSYGIVTVLLLMGVPLGGFLKGRWVLFGKLPRASLGRRHRFLIAAWRGFLDAAAIGVSTVLVSLVCGVLFFGLFTPGVFLANLILIPVAMFVIFAGFLSMLTGVLLFGFGGGLPGVFNHAGILILAGIEWCLRRFVEVPGMFFEAHFRADWMGYATLGGVLSLVMAGYAAGWKREWWFAVPFGFLAVMLVVGVGW